MYQKAIFIPSILLLSMCFAPLTSMVRAEDEMFFNVDGMKLAYRVRGEGQPVVILNGMTSNKEGWDELQTKLVNAKFRVIGLDCRGHGQSSKPHDPRQYGAEMAKDVVRLLDHLGIEKTHLVGYSMGAHIALKTCELAPERVTSVCLGGVTRPTTDGWATAPYDPKLLSQALKEGRGWTEYLRVPGAVTKGVISIEEAEKLNEDLTKGNDSLAIAAVIDSYSQLNVADDALRMNEIPMLIVMGIDDPGYPSAKRMADVTANARFESIDGANHFNAAQRDETLKLIEEFIKSNER